MHYHVFIETVIIDKCAKKEARCKPTLLSLNLRPCAAIHVDYSLFINCCLHFVIAVRGLQRIISREWVWYGQEMWFRLWPDKSVHQKEEICYTSTDAAAAVRRQWLVSIYGLLFTSSFCSCSYSIMVIWNISL